MTLQPGLYIHVPFCKTKCSYCDFYSITAPDLIPAYLTALDQEAQIYRAERAAIGGTGVPPGPAQAEACGYREFDSLFLGGGTPSLLSAAQLAQLFNLLRRHFAFVPEAEITIEVNPDDITAEKLRLFRDLGVNRLSLGVQSFDEAELRFLQRRHTAAQTLRAIELSRAAGFDNLSLDLMYGLPGQRRESWLRSLEQALSWQPEHLSCYQLTLAPETPLGRRAARGEVALLDEETERDFFLLTSRYLTGHNYVHYEVSNFARSQESPAGGRCHYVCRHNLKYWRHVPYLGLGPGAHSFDGRRRWWNFSSLEHYCTALVDGKTPVAGQEVLTKEQRRLETLFLGFRTREGVEMDLLREHPGWEAALAGLTDSGLVAVDCNRVVATPLGLVVADHLPLYFTA
jgi:putative oxygen-independent coproporphyrinogen III oxidase